MIGESSKGVKSKGDYGHLSTKMTALRQLYKRSQSMEPCCQTPEAESHIKADQQLWLTNDWLDKTFPSKWRTAISPARYWCVWTKFKNNSKIKSKKREEKRGASESSPLLYIRWKHGKSNENSVFPLIPMWNRKKIVMKLIFSLNTRLDPGILA